MITLITMGQGNPVALKTTLDSFKGLCNEVIYGDVLLFEEDRKIIESYTDYSMKIIKYPPNYIYKNGFSAILNDLASHAKNNWVIYMNTSEIIDTEYSSVAEISKLFYSTDLKHNCYYFTHAVDKHHWIRLYKKSELKWSGIIHEEVTGTRVLCDKPIFVMADTPKDYDNQLNHFKGKVYNDIKEIVYWGQLLKLATGHQQGGTNPGWIAYAKENYEHKLSKMKEKGERFEAFAANDVDKYLELAKRDL